MNISNWILNNGETMQYAVFLLFLLTFGIIEAVFPRTAGADRRLRWRTNFAVTTINVLAMGFLPTSFIGAAIWAQRQGYGLFNWLAAGPVGAVVMTLLLRALLSYGTHVAMHKVPLFWRVHRVHHTDTLLDVSTTVRFHPLEFFVNLALGVPFVVLLGLSPWVLMLYEILDAGVNVLTHANVSFPDPIDRLVRPLLVTPKMHLIHHSSFQPETDSNYGAVFSFWDFAFGTHRWEARRDHELKIGLEELRGRDAQKLFGMLISPFREKLSGSVQRRRRFEAA